MRIDVFQDTVCPWCRIGKQHLAQALEQWDGEPVEVAYHAFLLDPTTPEEGRPYSALAERLGGEARLQEAHSHVCQAGEACGIQFNFSKSDKIPNTLLSHQLIQLAPKDTQANLVDAVMSAYFEEGRDIGVLDVLLDLAEQVGMNRTETKSRIEAGEGIEEVKEDLEYARQVGISGVPFFILNNKYAISGAQPVSLFLQALNKTVSEK